MRKSDHTFIKKSFKEYIYLLIYLLFTLSNSLNSIGFQDAIYSLSCQAEEILARSKQALQYGEISYPVVQNGNFVQIRSTGSYAIACTAEGLLEGLNI